MTSALSMHRSRPDFKRNVPDLSPIRTIKEVVRLEDYAGSLTILRKAGESLRGKCPIHDGDNPEAFCVWPSEQRWQCFRCDQGGDLIDLCQAVQSCDTKEAIRFLVFQYRVEMPGKSDAWIDWQNQKGQVRKTVQQHLARVYLRRLTRLYAPLVLVGGESPEEEVAQLESLADSLWPVSLSLADQRVNGG